MWRQAEDERPAVGHKDLSELWADRGNPTFGQRTGAEGVPPRHNRALHLPRSERRVTPLACLVPYYIVTEKHQNTVSC